MKMLETKDWLPLRISTGILLLACCCCNLNGQQEGWKSLFDGESLAGWTQRGGKAKYEVVNGEIVGSTVPNTPNSFLCTEQIYGDFELQVEFKVHPELNSGIQIRSNSDKGYKNGQVHGYQIEIDPADRAWSGGVYDEGRRGWLDDHKSNNAARYAFKQNAWNHFRIRAIDDRIQTWINDVPAADLRDEMTGRGFIALQVHGVGKREDELTVRWKNIKILENPPLDDTYETIKELIPVASAINVIDLRKLATAASPSADSIKSKSLTLMMLQADSTPVDTSQSHLEYGSQAAALRPTDIFDEIARDGTGSMIQYDRITNLVFNIDEDQVKGVFSFDVPKLYRGRANFVAKKRGNEWQITEFSMPARRVFIERDGQEGWKVKKPLPVFPEGVEVKKLAGGFKFTEGPAVGPDGRIYFNDIPNQTTHVFDPRTKETTEFRKETGNANGLFWTASDALISCEGGSRTVTRSIDGKTEILASEFEGKKLNSPNDLALDTVGGIYFTDPRYGDSSDLEMNEHGVYYIARDRKISRVVDDLVKPNGIVLSPDFNTLYVADHQAAKTWAYDVVGDGKLKNKKLFAEIGSDGMSVDRDGNVYFTWKNSIVVYSGGGEKIAELETPEPPANCTLVGSTLYITARSGLYSVETNQLGLLD